MYSFKDGSLVPVKCQDIVMLGAVTDGRILLIETIVAKAYKTSVHELDVFYKDTPAKLMCCFLLHDLLGYSVKSISKKYCIYEYFLDNKIQEHYKKCLQNVVFMKHVKSLSDKFLNKEKLNIMQQNVNNAVTVSGI